MNPIRISPLVLLCLVFSGFGCALNPTYTVRIDNETERAVQVSLERRPTINEIITMDSVRVRGESSRLLGPSEARPFERVYIVVGDRTDLHAVPESLEINRGQWIVTIAAGSITSWGTYELKVRKADEPLVQPEDAGENAEQD